MDDTSRFNQWTRNTTIVITKDLPDLLMAESLQDWAANFREHDLVKWLGVAALARRQ